MTAANESNNLTEPVQMPLFDPIRPQYLIDTNCLIKPYNDYYNPAFALSETFWSRLKALVREGTIGILDKVWDETYGGRNSDELDAWLDDIQKYVINSEDDSHIVDGFKQVIRVISAPDSGYRPQAIRDWADIRIADPWLIGAASQFQSAIITFEKPQNTYDRPWKHLKIPTVANMLNVHCVDLFTFMNTAGGF